MIPTRMHTGMTAETQKSAVKDSPAVFCVSAAAPCRPPWRAPSVSVSAVAIKCPENAMISPIKCHNQAPVKCHDHTQNAYRYDSRVRRRVPSKTHPLRSASPQRRPAVRRGAPPASPRRQPPARPLGLRQVARLRVGSSNPPWPGHVGPIAGLRAPDHAGVAPGFCRPADCLEVHWGICPPACCLGVDWGIRQPA